MQQKCPLTLKSVAPFALTCVDSVPWRKITLRLKGRGCLSPDRMSARIVAYGGPWGLRHLGGCVGQR